MSMTMNLHNVRHIVIGDVEQASSARWRTVTFVMDDGETLSVSAFPPKPRDANEPAVIMPGD